MDSWKDIGNPYFNLLHPTGKTSTVNAWARTGFRKGLANYPWFVDGKSGDIVVSERDNHRIQIFDVLGNETRFKLYGGQGHGRTQLYQPAGITTTDLLDAKVICADSGNRRVVLMKTTSDYHGNRVLCQTASFGHQVFQHPMGLDYDATRDFLLVTDTSTRRVTLHDLRNGATVGEMRPPHHCPLVLPADVAIDDMGRAYVTDAGSAAIQVFDKSGNFITKFGCKELSKPWGICFDRQNNLLVSDETDNKIVMYSAAGSFTRVIADDVYRPKGICVNAHGRLVVACGDPYNFLRILQYV